MSEVINWPFIISVVIIVFLSLWLISFYLPSNDITEIVVPKDPNFEYKDNVYLIKGNNFSIDDTSITLQGLKPELKINDILIGNESPGFLRRITNIQIIGKTRVLTTEKLDIGDVIKSGVIENIYSIDSTNQLEQNISENTPSRSILFKLSRSSRSISNLDPSNYLITNTQSSSYNLPFTKTITLNNISKMMTGSLIIYGNLKIVPTIYLNLDIGITGVNNFSITLYFNIESEIGENLSVDCTNAVNVNWSQLFPIGKWTVPVCTGVWVTMSPNVTIGCNLNLSGKLNVHNKLVTKTISPYVVGFSYANSSVTPTFYAGNFSTPTVVPVTNQVSASISLTPSIDFKMDFMLWGLVGPFIDLYLYAKYNQKVTCSLSTKTCSGTIEPLLGFDANLGGSLYGYSTSFNLYSKTWSIPTIKI